MSTLGLGLPLHCLVGPVRGGLAWVVLESPNAGIGPVGVVLGVPTCTELAIVVVRSPNVRRRLSGFSQSPRWLLCVVSGVPARGVLAYIVLGFPTGVWRRSAFGIV